MAALLFAADQVPVDREITKIRAYGGAAFIYFTPAFKNTQNCSIDSEGNAVVLEFKDGAHREMYSTALAAASAKQKVGFGIDGCYKDRPLIYRIDVHY